MAYALVVAMLLALSRMAGGQCTPALYPSNPITIVGDQGRPIPGTTVQISDYTTNQPVTAYIDKTGCVVTTTVPPSGVYQFFTQLPGTFNVSVQGQGVTRAYVTTTSAPVGSDVGLVSVDRTATDLSNSPNPGQATYDCTNYPCIYSLPESVNTALVFDFVTPSFPIKVSSVSMSYYGSGNGIVVFGLDWCSYGQGGLPCLPTGNNLQSYPFQNSGIGQEQINTVVQLNMTWGVTQHVVVYVWRLGASGGDTYSDPINFDNVRLEMTK